MKTEFIQVEGDTRDLLTELTTFLNSQFTTQEQMESRMETLMTDWAMANGLIVEFRGDTAQFRPPTYPTWITTKKE